MIPGLAPGVCQAGREAGRRQQRRIKLALRAGANSIEHGTVMDDEIIKMMKAAPAGVKIAFGTDADLLGLASKVGTIEPGKSADIIAVTGDPLSDVTLLKRVDFVMARGAVINAGTGD